MQVEVIISCIISVSDENCASVTELAEAIESGDIMMEIDTGLEIIEATVENATLEEA